MIVSARDSQVMCVCVSDSLCSQFTDLPTPPPPAQWISVSLRRRPSVILGLQSYMLRASSKCTDAPSVISKHSGAYVTV